MRSKLFNLVGIPLWLLSISLLFIPNIPASTLERELGAIGSVINKRQSASRRGLGEAEHRIYIVLS